MNLRLEPAKLAGKVQAIPSKSMAHRLLLCAALADRETKIICPLSSRDIEATVRCLEAMGASLWRQDAGFKVFPMRTARDCILPCGESGSTLRFLLPVAAALGLRCSFRMEGRLPYRPIAPLEREMNAHGVIFDHSERNVITISGKLLPGLYTLPGNISSQFISGFLFALPLLAGESRLRLSGRLESAPYVDMTLSSLQTFGVCIKRQQQEFLIRPSDFKSPGATIVEGDWSCAAFWHAANALGSSIRLFGLNAGSPQGDRTVLRELSRLGSDASIDAADIPDLIPVLAVAATAAAGQTHFINAGRLRLKESDRIEAVKKLILSLGGQAQSDRDSLTVVGTGLSGGMADPLGDHRIAMSAAIAATVSKGPVTILGAECVSKSYPGFWNDYAALGGILEEV